MKKWLIFIGALIVVIVVLLIVRGNEDSWIKDGRGVWVKHGNPKETPQEVIDQQKIISDAQAKFNKEKQSGKDIGAGPCLGEIRADWVLDVVHEPREANDDQSQNQCADYIDGKVHHFIEIDQSGNVIRIK